MSEKVLIYLGPSLSKERSSRNRSRGDYSLEREPAKRIAYTQVTDRTPTERASEANGYLTRENRKPYVPSDKV
jgi:hypothetical protein